MFAGLSSAMSFGPLFLFRDSVQTIPPCDRPRQHLVSPGSDIPAIAESLVLFAYLPGAGGGEDQLSSLRRVQA